MKILIAGDYAPKDRIQSLLNNNNFSFFDSIITHTKNCDYSIINLEAPIADSKVDKPIAKCGPHLFTSPNVMDSILYAGFNCVTLANNHFRDYGDSGVNKTIDAARQNNIDTVGGGKNLSEATQVLYKQICSRNLAIINVCEHEFSIANINHGGSAPLDVIDVCNRIKEAKAKTDYILLIIHGGHEMFQLPSPRMKKWYRFFVDCGADAVVNHHQHCYSGYEYYQGKPIVYGLGNFCFDWNGKRNNIWNEGYMAIMDFDKTIKLEVIPYTQCNEKTTISIMQGKEITLFDTKIEELNKIIQSNELLESRYADFCKSKMHTTKATFCPSSNKIIRGLMKYGLLPYFISKKKATVLIDKIECEAHRDCIINNLKNI